MYSEVGIANFLKATYWPLISKGMLVSRKKKKEEDFSIYIFIYSR